MSSNYFTRPVLPLLSAMIPGVVTGLEFPFFKKTAYFLMLLCLANILHRIIHSRTALFSPLLLFFLSGYLLILPYTEHQQKSNPVTAMADEKDLEITGTVDNTTASSPHRIKFLLKVESVIKNRNRTPGGGFVRVHVNDCKNRIKRGDRIRFTGRIRPFRNFTNPGSFDYKQYMAFQKVWGRVYVKKRNIHFIQPASPNVICGWFSLLQEKTKRHIFQLIESSCRNHRSQGILKALTTGDRNHIPPPLKEAFNRTGAGHLLAISGLHIGIVGSGAFFLFLRLVSLCEALLWRGKARQTAAFLSILPVVAYGIIAGMSPSTQRAVITVSLLLSAYGIKGEHDTMNTLAIAALLILVVFPPSLFFISFQLSFAAVFSIIYGLSQTGRLRPKEQRGATGIKERTTTFILTSTLAITGTLPLLLHCFNQVSLIGIFANLLLVPLIGFITVPAALAALFISPLSCPIAKILMTASGKVLELATYLVTLLSNLPFAAIKTVTPNYLEIGCFYLIFFSILNLASTREKESPDHKPDNKKRIAGYVLASAFFILMADGAFWLKIRCFHRDFRVTVIDVGQGSAVLLEFPGGESMLIDGGGFHDNAVFDVGEKIVAPFLWRKKIRTVETVVLTHPESDHLNGLLFILEHFHVKKVISNGQKADTFSYKRFSELIEQKGIGHEFSKTMTKNGVRLNIIYPPADSAGKCRKTKWRGFNNNSVVIQAKYGSASFLFPGDIMQKAEEELIERERNRLKSTVLLAPHHGSSTASTTEFLNTVAPQVVIISAGWKNRFHLPHKKVLERLEKNGCTLYSTAINGAVLLKTDGKRLIIEPTAGQGPGNNKIHRIKKCQP